MNDSQLRQILSGSHTIATVGFSSNPDRAGYYVPEYLLEQGYHVIPVNPTLKNVLGQKAYPDLLAVPERVDIVQIFRAPEEVPAVVEQAIQIGAKVVWMQPGAGNRKAAKRAQEAGLSAVVDRCMMVEHNRLIGS